MARLLYQRDSTAFHLKAVARKELGASYTERIFPVLNSRVKDSGAEETAK